MNLAGWERDFGLLFGGLWKGFLDLARWWSETFSLADVLSWLLLLTLVYTILSERIGAVRCRRWGVVLLYTAFIYATLPMFPAIWKTLVGYTDYRINLAGGLAAALFGTWLTLHLVLRRRERRLRILAAWLAVGGVYTICLFHLHTSPAERLHLAEYGLLGHLAFRALRVDMGYRAAYLWGWILSSGLGALDEGIQAWLPNRAGEWSDITLNILSCGLGLLVTAMISDTGTAAPEGDAPCSIP